MDDLTVELEGKLDYTVLRLAGPLSMRSVPLAADLGSAWVAVQQRPDRVRILRQFAPAPVESSRVRAFASSWGVERQPDGKTVWARLPVSCADGMHQPCTDLQRG
jgi:hypothetical protein